MVTEKAKRKARILAFWQKHGLEATIEAFGTKRRTLYFWKRQQKDGGGSFEALNEKSKRPKSVRYREWPSETVAEIRRLRTKHPNLGKEKICILLRSFCVVRNLRCPSARTVGRLIADAPGKMRIFPAKVHHDGTIVLRKRQKRLRKPKGFIAMHPGHCGSFDTVERFIHGCRRYVVTFTDIFSRFTFAYATTSHASTAARECFRLVTAVFPYRLEYILTDNGSEFMKHFDEELRSLHKTHWHTYPRTPKMNAHCERFNRTIQEEFVDYHVSLLLDVRKFNDALLNWLLWYNGERPHWSLGLKSPIQFLTAQTPGLCNMWWPDTKTSK
jgi:transposase InsO family protein